ncbi:SAM-dependent methyltransferase [Cycloclasticus zancles 78-ME]|uniref:SAM-dependent methyltransferase n=1 Tax=Cycloclasticus zancles 78-ME TaxID=1198232 RepID=S5TG04_9GAMM|nr:SAM-dependent methyltransferase [Cycloclasticus zancles 78-ME]
MFWCCPNCHADLEESADLIRCTGCNDEFPIIAGIPDLRVKKPSWIDYETDRLRALQTEALVHSHGLEAAILGVFKVSRQFDDQKAEFRLKQVLSGVDKCEASIESWLKPFVEMESPVLEIGCGPGQLMAAAARHNVPVISVDISVEWLVVAKHLTQREGRDANLVAGHAEHLPIKPDSIGSVISLDVIEHVGDQFTYISEIERILEPEGVFALTTPNRFSMSPEPHVGVWGVGYLPVFLQDHWVKLVSGRSYDFTRLLSVFEARKLFKRCRHLEIQIKFPPIPVSELNLFFGVKSRLARIYNSMIDWRLVKPLMPFFGAYYRLTGIKKS